MQVIRHKGKKLEQLSTRRRAEWLAKINRKNWRPGPGSRVCSVHFVHGKPAELFDDTNPDWVPSVLMGYNTKEGSFDRYHRSKRRKESHNDDECDVNSLPVDNSVAGDNVTIDSSVPVDGSGTEIFDVSEQDSTLQLEQTFVMPCEQNDLHVGLEDELARLRMDNQVLREENLKLRSQVVTTGFTPHLFENNESVLKFYTALPNWTVFKAIFDLVLPSLPTMPNSKLSPFEVTVMFFMRIRLNLVEEDIGYRFGVHQSTVSRNFHKVLDVMDAKLSHLIKWPDREILRETLPMCFRRFFKKCCIIIDCTEVFVERPSDLMARAQTWSNYKHHNTVKFLLGITPQGTISYISRAAGGRMSDKQIVESSDLIGKLLPGDVVIADRGFTCDEYAHMALAEIKIPPFTKGKKQLEKVELDWSRELSMVRIHVERVIGQLKQKYTLLQSVLPISVIADKDDEAATVDKIVRVCCALVNLSPSVVPQD